MKAADERARAAQGSCERLFIRARYVLRSMNRLRIGIRWWLAGAFAAIAVLTAVLTTAVSSRQVGRDVSANAREIAIGATVSAGFEIERAISSGKLAAQTRASGAKYGLALFVICAMYDFTFPIAMDESPQPDTAGTG